MIPNNAPLVAIIHRRGRRHAVRVMGWDDRGNALIAAPQGTLLPAASLAGFAGLEDATSNEDHTPLAPHGFTHEEQVAESYRLAQEDQARAEARDDVKSSEARTREELRDVVRARHDAGRLSRDAYRVAHALTGEADKVPATLARLAAHTSTPKARIPAALIELSRDDSALAGRLLALTPAGAALIAEAHQAIAQGAPSVRPDLRLVSGDA